MELSFRLITDEQILHLQSFSPPRKNSYTQDFLSGRAAAESSGSRVGVAGAEAGAGTATSTSGISSGSSSISARRAASELYSSPSMDSYVLGRTDVIAVEAFLRKDEAILLVPHVNLDRIQHSTVEHSNLTLCVERRKED